MYADNLARLVLIKVNPVELAYQDITNQLLLSVLDVEQDVTSVTLQLIAPNAILKDTGLETVQVLADAKMDIILMKIWNTVFLINYKSRKRRLEMNDFVNSNRYIRKELFISYFF